MVTDNPFDGDEPTPDEYPWSEASDADILVFAEEEVPEAIAEAERRS